MQEPILSRLLTLPAAGRALGVSQKAIRAAIDRGDLEAVRLAEGGWPRVSEDAIRRWLSARPFEPARRDA